MSTEMKVLFWLYAITFMVACVIFIGLVTASVKRWWLTRRRKL
jgi:hypothetical protein